jgi:hypothetical protein
MAAELDRLPSARGHAGRWRVLGYGCVRSGGRCAPWAILARRAARDACKGNDRIADTRGAVACARIP